MRYAAPLSFLVGLIGVVSVGLTYVGRNRLYHEAWRLGWDSAWRGMDRRERESAVGWSPSPSVTITPYTLPDGSTYHPDLTYTQAVGHG